MIIAELIGLFVIGLIIGLSLAMFTKTVLKVFLFFTGFYILITALLWYLHIIVFTISWSDVYHYIMHVVSSIRSNPRSLALMIDDKHIATILGGIIGFIYGLRKL